MTLGHLCCACLCRVYNDDVNLYRGCFYLNPKDDFAHVGHVNAANNEVNFSAVIVYTASLHQGYRNPHHRRYRDDFCGGYRIPTTNYSTCSAGSSASDKFASAFSKLLKISDSGSASNAVCNHGVYSDVGDAST